MMERNMDKKTNPTGLCFRVHRCVPRKPSSDKEQYGVLGSVFVEIPSPRPSLELVLFIRRQKAPVE